MSLKQHYAELYERHGASHEAVQWSSRETQQRRFDVLCDVIGQHDWVIDLGAGLGDLLGYLRQKRGFQGKYQGYDFVPGFVAHARETYRADALAAFDELDITRQELPSGYDVIVTSGMFNNAMDDNWGFLTSTLARMYRAAGKRVAFNAMSTYVDFQAEGLYYCDPLRLFDHVKRELTPLVTLRHDYRVKPDRPPFEFAMYLER
jgi:cyclopropane fatty-acyl-phospholipid synthase-like methyltransferase